MRKAIAVDFDGTLCDSKYPSIGAPHMEIIEAAKDRQRNGYALILWTCRDGKPLDEAVEWCKQFGLVFDAVNENLPDWKDEWFGNDPRKIGATEYWDDRSRDLNSIITGEHTWEPLKELTGLSRSCLWNGRESISTPLKLIPTRCRLKCPNCGHIITDKNCKKINIKYCWTCGQALDWGVENAEIY